MHYTAQVGTALDSWPTWIRASDAGHLLVIAGLGDSTTRPTMGHAYIGPNWQIFRHLRSRRSDGCIPQRLTKATSQLVNMRFWPYVACAPLFPTWAVPVFLSSSNMSQTCSRLIRLQPDTSAQPPYTRLLRQRVYHFPRRRRSLKTVQRPTKRKDRPNGGTRHGKGTKHRPLSGRMVFDVDDWVCALYTYSMFGVYHLH